MLICRCAWHPRYFGYPHLSGVVSWRGWALQFTDGICSKCAQRFRTEHAGFLARQRPYGSDVPETSTVQLDTATTENRSAA